MGLLQTIQECNQKRIQYLEDNFTKEEGAKIQLFLPILLEMRWNPFECEHCKYEAEENKRTNGAAADIELRNELLEPIIAVELKKVGTPLNKYIDQTKRYFQKPTVRWGILTNLVDMWFFTDSLHPNLMDDFPFYRIHLPNVTEADIAFLEKFNRDYLLSHLEQVHEECRGMAQLSLPFVVQHLMKVTNLDKGFIEKTLRQQFSAAMPVQGVSNKQETEKKGKTRVRTPFPNLIRVLGEVIESKNGKDFYIQFLEKLIQHEPQKMATIPEWFSSGGTRFSRDNNVFPPSHKDYEIIQLSNGIYVTTHQNKEECFQYCRTILDNLGYSSNDFQILTVAA